VNQAFAHSGETWATVDIIADDAASFGFPVAWMSLVSAPPVDGALELDEWAERNGVVVTGVSVSATATDLLQHAQNLGFLCVDLSLHVSMLNIKRRSKTVRPAVVRTATAADMDGIEAIALTAFNFGRYHRDARFPKKLADRRFGAWMKKAWSNPAPSARFFVIGPPGDPSGFMFAEVNDGRAQWQLGGVSRTASNGLMGPMLFAGVLDALEAEGVRTVAAKISAANTPVLNIYAALGFDSSKPEFTLHRHLPDSPNLLPLIQ
jgi:hypothetical protein